MAQIALLDQRIKSYALCLVGPALLSLGISIAARNYALKKHHELEPIASVGDLQISEKDVQNTNAITKIYYPDETRDLGLLQLKNAYLMAQVLKNNGWEITDATLKTESKRIDQTTQRPEILAKIKGLFPNNEHGYLYVYVLPVYVKRVIYYDFFLKNPAIHAPSKKVAERFLESVVHQPEKLVREAKNSGIRINTFEVSLSRGIEWNTNNGNRKSDISSSSAANKIPLDIQHQFQPTMDSRKVSEEAQKWINDVANQLKPGQVFPKIVEMNDAWMIVKFSGQSKAASGVYHFEAVSFPKADFNDWLEKEKNRVPIVDRSLKEKQV